MKTKVTDTHSYTSLIQKMNQKKTEFPFDRIKKAICRDYISFRDFCVSTHFFNGKIASIEIQESNSYMNFSPSPSKHVVLKYL